ncbi:MAG: tRNA pseudouridine(55) synthase TruB [Ruminococcaceae bacterium]|nr:tRNA pseudouridine(55) synthase TruB [Oscillospiraceae bacterium]
MSVNGILCLDKPSDMTSFSCCAVVRRLLGTKKVGHAGTLDPQATGVLPILVGNATRALDFLPDHTKRYVATLRFGAVSDTLDVWGQVSETNRPLPTKAALEAALPAFRGDILQVPPMVSALKKDGKRLYDLARQGIEVEREARPVTVHALTLLEFDEAAGTAVLDCTCSKGTYIRTLCDDLGRALGCGAVMTALRRTAAIGLSETQAISLDTARTLAEEGTLAARLISTEMALQEYPPLTVSEAQAVRFRNGGALALDRLKGRAPTGLCRVYAPDGTFIGLGRPEADELKVARLFLE